MITEFFNENATLVLFLHVISAIIWVGGMIAIRLAVHPAMQNIEEPKVKMARTLEILRNFFSIVTIAVALIIVTAVVMSVGMGFKGTDLSVIVHVKEAIWLIMTLNFGVMIYRRNRAERAFLSGAMQEAKEMLEPLAKFMIPVNIILGIVALYLGITLRGF